MFTPRLSVRTSPPWEGLGEAPWGCSSPSSFYCSRRDAADGMPVMALVLIFVSPPTPQKGAGVFDVLLPLFKEVYITSYSQKNILHNHKDYEECSFQCIYMTRQQRANYKCFLLSNSISCSNQSFISKY